jgi:hypothetical protein
MTRSGAALSCVALLIACGLNAQQTSAVDNNLFSKYPEEVTFHGHPAAPVLTDPAARSFRTRIREGAAKGPVFADHYGIAAWGCGTSCISFAIIDSITGRVYVFPYTVSAPGHLDELLTFHRDSRVIHVVGSLNEMNPADRWYLWDGKQLNLIHEKPAKLAEDSNSLK